MSSDFLLYLRLGFEHISDLKGYDHIVFIVALCAVYSIRQWRNLLWLVTAFTIGHSVTLALATLNILTLDPDLIEFLIPVTILIASLLDLGESWLHRNPDPKPGQEKKGILALVGWKPKYALALTFGLIHGLGFSNFLRAILGGEESILVPLLAFNVGLEFGQIAILLGILAISFGVVSLTRLSQRNWTVLLSVVTLGIAISMLFSRYSNL